MTKRRFFRKLCHTVGLTVLGAFIVSGGNAQPVPAASGEAEVDSPGRSRPRLLLWAEGSPDDDVIWRGWPVLVRTRAVVGDPPSEVQLRGPSSVPLTKAGSLRYIKAAESARLVPGSYSLVAGEVSVDVSVAEPPSALSSGQQAVRLHLLAEVALASGEVAAAKEAAGEWVRTEPDSHEAYEVLGDTLHAAGDSDAALAAYNNALRRVPPRIDPPPAGLHLKIAALVAASAAALPKGAGAQSTPDESSYFGMIAAGDAALKAGNRTEAARRYAEAGALRREKTLAVPPLELDEKRVALASALAGQPGVSIPPQAAPAPVPSPIRSPVANTAPAPVASPPATPPPVTPAPRQPAVGTPSKGEVVPVAELDEVKILADPNGRWVASAAAGSQYSSPNYGAAKMTGPPDVPTPGDNVNAWCHGSSAATSDWVELTFAQPQPAVEIRVRQTNCPGAIARVEAFESDGTSHLWWEGVDPAKAPAQASVAWFAVRVPRTDYAVAKIKLTLNLAAVPGWKQIDSVQLVSAPR